MSAGPDEGALLREQLDYVVRWIEERAATDPAFLVRVKLALDKATLSPPTRERLDRELERLGSRTRQAS